MSYQEVEKVIILPLSLEILDTLASLDLRELEKLEEEFENCLTLTKGKKFYLGQLLQALDLAGYERVEIPEYTGEFSHLGGVVQVFPLGYNSPFQIEFFGDYVERIKKISSVNLDPKAEIKRLKKKLKALKFFSQVEDLKPGDFVVHSDHGIGIFKGKTLIEGKSYFEIEYAKGDKLFVPEDLKNKLSLYIGLENPQISRLKSKKWLKIKRKVREETLKLAKKLLEIQAKRELEEKEPCFGDPILEKEVAQRFPFELTQDQEIALKEIFEDLKEAKPKERVLVGDVGFGKTEVIIRAVAKVVFSKKKALILAPTTLLALQHFWVFKERFKNLPVEVKVLTRLQSKKEQEEIKREIKANKVDILIGTHKLLSQNLNLKRVGIIVVDEEQKFGVKQKEKLKEIYPKADIIYVSATPIPRTLYFALSGLKEISLILTPPPRKLAVKTIVEPFNPEKIVEAINFELQRGGQVYFLYNFAKKLEKVKEFLKKISKGNPNWKIEVIHGRLKEKEVAKRFEKFYQGKANILVSTTIIENGLDLSKVNTLIVASSTRLGLAQAHQLRGRIGRREIQAFCYFFYPKGKLTPQAKERLKLLKELQYLGAGYLIAKKDLEMRGAGNLLGKEQSGHFAKVGVNLYCQMLADAIEKLKYEN